MTTRLKGVTVAFGHDIREDDAEWVINAIKMIKGVMDVKPIESQSQDWIIESRIRMDIRSKILDILKP